MHADHIQQLEQLLAVSNEASDVLGEQPHSVNVVIPCVKMGRGPYIEIRTVHDVDEQIDGFEEKWPEVEFEHLYTDEDGL